MRFLRAALVLAVLGAAVGLVASAGCEPTNINVWICENPTNHKLDPSIYDANHYVGGMPDPCHCYDPCGPQPTCPIVVDAGPLPSGCDGGSGSGGGGGGGGG
jgi:hypothetical protein